VSEDFSEEVQWHALSLLLLATQHSLLAQLEFEQLEGIGLVQQVLRSPQAAVGKKIAEVWRGEGDGRMGEGRGMEGELTLGVWYSLSYQSDLSCSLIWTNQFVVPY